MIGCSYVFVRVRVHADNLVFIGLGLSSGGMFFRSISSGINVTPKETCPIFQKCINPLPDRTPQAPDNGLDIRVLQE
jgi:hypothetical protein